VPPRPRRESAPRPRSRRARPRPSRSTSACAGRPRPRCPHDRASSANATVPDRASSIASPQEPPAICCGRTGRQHPCRRSPTRGGERSYQVRPILEGKNRGRHFVSKTPLAGSQIAFESDLGSAFEPNASPRPRWRPEFNTGIAFALAAPGVAPSPWRPMLRAELCCPRPTWAPLQGDWGLPAQHNFDAADGSRANAHGAADATPARLGDSAAQRDRARIARVPCWPRRLCQPSGATHGRTAARRSRWQSSRKYVALTTQRSEAPFTPEVASARKQPAAPSRSARYATYGDEAIRSPTRARAEEPDAAHESTLQPAADAARPSAQSLGWLKRSELAARSSDRRSANRATSRSVRATAGASDDARRRATLLGQAAAERQSAHGSEEPAPHDPPTD